MSGGTGKRAKANEQPHAAQESKGQAMATDATTLTVEAYELTLTGGDGPFCGSLSTEQSEDGVHLVRILIEADEAASPPVYTLAWRQPVVGIVGY